MTSNKNVAKVGFVFEKIAEKIFELFAVENLIDRIAEVLDGDFWAELEMRCAGSAIERNDTHGAIILHEEIRKVADDALDSSD